MRRTLPTLLLTGLLAAGATVPAVAAPPERTTILDATVGTADFQVLEDVVGYLAVNGYDLTAALDGRRQLTVFAPTNQAFLDLLGALEAGNLDELVAALDGVGGNSGVDNLATVVLYHVAPGHRLSQSVVSSSQITSLQGEKIQVDGTHVANATIDLGLADLDVANGVIHGIDAVMLPPSIVAALAS